TLLSQFVVIDWCTYSWLRRRFRTQIRVESVKERVWTGWSLSGCAYAFLMATGRRPRYLNDLASWDNALKYPPPSDGYKEEEEGVDYYAYNIDCANNFKSSFEIRGSSMEKSFSDHCGNLGEDAFNKCWKYIIDLRGKFLVCFFYLSVIHIINCWFNSIL
ncbi:hypothetical protein Tsubulata_049184, partial [Turnera subulata]